MTDTPEGNGWDEYQNLVLYRLDELGKRVDKLACRLDELKIGLARMEVKGGVWGAVTGALTGIGGALLWFIIYRSSH